MWQHFMLHAPDLKEHMDSVVYFPFCDKVLKKELQFPVSFVFIQVKNKAQRENEAAPHWPVAPSAGLQLLCVSVCSF